MNLTKRLFLIFAILSVLSINTILNNTTVFASINGSFAVTNNTTDTGGGNIRVSNNPILVKPSSLEEEHKEIHEKLEKIVSSSGDTVNMSKQVPNL